MSGRDWTCGWTGKMCIRDRYSMEPHSYVEIPKSIADKIITERGRNTAD